MKVSVYLGSSINCKPEYNALAFEVGARLASAGHVIVYGGANVGTMKDIADGAQSVGGDVIGVFPSGFAGTEEVKHHGMKVIREGLKELVYVKNFAERKQTMEDLSDCALILPGSFGTLDELFTYTCNNAIGMHSKPVFILNHKGFYSPLVDLVRNTAEAGFLKPETVSILTFCDTIDEVIEHLK